MARNKVNTVYNRFGEKAYNMSVKENEVRPKHLCKKPDHKLRIEIRPGLWVYTKEGATPKEIEAIKQKYQGK